MSRRLACGALVLAAVIWFWGPLSTVITLSLHYGQYEHYSHIIAIPFLTLFLIYVERRTVFAVTAWAPRAGSLILAAGLAIATAGRMGNVGGESAWTVGISSMVTTCIGAFVLCYGGEAFRRAAFPLLLLILMTPLPPALLHAIISFLQKWSAEGSAVLFDLLGVPVYREGFLFALPGLTIEIAEECSGIRSSLALFIVGLVAGHMCLRRSWSKTALAVIVVPLAIVKNAVRIVVLSLLAIHVDPSFITGSAVHRYSGIPLFAVSFAILGGVIWLLQHSEAWAGKRATGISA